MVGQSPPDTPLTGAGFGNPNNTEAPCMAVFGGSLYVGTTGLTYWSQVMRYNSGGWTRVDVDAMSKPIVSGVTALADYSGNLYVGTDQTWGGVACEVWASADGTTWTRVDGGALGANNKAATSMAAYGSRLWVGTHNQADGCQVWSTAAAGGPPYTDWTLENAGGFGDKDNIQASCMAVYFSGLNVGTSNIVDGCEIWSSGLAWYLAEGATTGGFETWVLVQNPGTTPVHVNFTLNTDYGEMKPAGLQNFSIPAGSRVSFNIGKEVTTFNVSTNVEATDGNVICERAMYFTPAGASQRVLGHDSIGFVP